MQVKAPIRVLFPYATKIEIFSALAKLGNNTIVELFPALTQARD